MSNRSINADPRKQPRQARAKATVDAVITAAAQVLVEHGYERTTTARVAERAGVSIGSLYQYFPNKEALVATLIERHADDIVATMRQALQDPAHATLEDGLRAIIHAGITAHRIHPDLHKILNEQVPRVGRLGKALDTSRQVAKAIEHFLRAHQDEIHPDRDPAIAAVVVETAFEALGHKAVLERRSPLTQAVAAREAYCLLAAYLAPPAGTR